jgi:rhodanese-related sulfurtransferase
MRYSSIHNYCNDSPGETGYTMKNLFPGLMLAMLLLYGCSDGTSPDSSVAAALAQRIAAGQDHITAAELADRLIRDLRDFELVDIRNEQDYASGHIRGARNIPLARLIAADSLESLPAGRTVVVYSNGSAHAAQAALLLHLAGRDALALLGGYNYWQAFLHDPEAAGVAEMDPAARQRYQAVSCYFAGDYVAGSGLPPAGNMQAGDTVPASAQQADPLGLGLDLGLGSEQVRTMELQDSATPVAEDDPPGPGLAPGSGRDGAGQVITPAVPAQDEARKLLIRAEC